ncbi:MAG: hypothetical protein VB141_12035 [Burkholderia gladioli]
MAYSSRFSDTPDLVGTCHSKMPSPAADAAMRSRFSTPPESAGGIVALLVRGLDMCALLLHELANRGMRGGTEEILDHPVRHRLDVAVPIAVREEFARQLPQAALEQVQLAIQIFEAITKAPARTCMRLGAIPARQQRHGRLDAAAQQFDDLVQNRRHAVEQLLDTQAANPLQRGIGTQRSNPSASQESSPAFQIRRECAQRHAWPRVHSHPLDVPGPVFLIVLSARLAAAAKPRGRRGYRVPRRGVAPPSPCVAASSKKTPAACMHVV